MTAPDFEALLYTGPLMRGDAIVLLEGDGLARIPAAVELLKQGAGPFIIVTGGVDNPPHQITAEKIAGRLMGLGVGPDRILVDNDSQNTYEQATRVLSIAKEHDWTRLTLVASAYHAPRAFLTFLKVLAHEGQEKHVLLSVVPEPSDWFATPEGLKETRFELRASERQKVIDYAAKGHVASYEEGIAYLRYWRTPVAKEAA